MTFTFSFHMRCSNCGKTFLPWQIYKPCPKCGAPYYQTYAEFYNEDRDRWEYLTKPYLIETTK